MSCWQVFGAVILRRLPEVVPKQDSIQIKVQQILNAYEASRSRYSLHEMQHLEETRLKDDPDSDVIIKETAQDLEDRWLQTKSMFQFAQHNDRLTKTHYLFMNSIFGTDIKHQWLLPQAAFDRKLGDQSLFDTARRALKDSLNIINGYRIVSKIPSSVQSFKYPKKVQELTGFNGAKVFYLKAHLDLPDTSVLKAVDDNESEHLKWLTRDEAQSIVSKKYMEGFKAGLLTEERVDVSRVLQVVAENLRK